MIADVDPVGALCCLLIAIAALAAVGGYVAGIVRQRQHHARRYFALGVVTGFVGASVLRHRLGRTVTRRLVLPRRLDNPLTVAALQLRRKLPGAR